MVSESTRRALLRGCGATACASFAGCTSAFGSDDGGPRDAYGVVLENDLEESHTVSMLAREIIEDEVVFEETAEIGPGEERRWEEVFVDHGTYRLSASVDHPDFTGRDRSDGTDIRIDDDRGPAVENVLVLLEYRENESVPEDPGPRVFISHWGHPDEYRDDD